MAKCKNCKKCLIGEDIFIHGARVYPFCGVDGEEVENLDEDKECIDFECMTNADRIRSMTDEELAELLGTRFDVASVCENLEDGCWYKCKTHECDYDETKLIIKWLKSEVGCE